VSEVLVTGGTGHLGQQLVPLLLEDGHDVRVLSRRADAEVPGVRVVRGDLTTSEGVEEAMRGAGVIVHCASGTGKARSLTYRSARRTDVVATARMLELAKRHGTPHIVYTSIVGVDRIPLGYYRAKLECEHVIEASELPYTILRTTQWHSLAWEFCLRLTRPPAAIVPRGMRAQLLDPSEVAERMRDLVNASPSGRAPDMGGPEILTSRDVVDVFIV
jgi:uncharacterized protein YbjT (DUF2867 family)